MKESGMEKLIELLNEYGNEICNHWGNYQTDMDFTDRDTYWYLSKKFGFIKWLVENDKIDFRKLDFIQKFSGDIPARYYLGTYIRYSFENEIVMALSIQDEPIEFLVSILE